jgi:hypothetical protein
MDRFGEPRVRARVLPAQSASVAVGKGSRIVAKILPEAERACVPYFARRQYVSPGIKRLIESGRLGRRGTDSTIATSEDREDRACCSTSIRPEQDPLE